MNSRVFTKPIFFLLALVCVLILEGAFFFFMNAFRSKNIPHNTTPPFSDTQQKSITPTPLPAIPASKVLPTSYHIFQTFNNCGPASLSMALAFYGISVSQEVLGESIRPYQVANGDNDDKSVTLDELAAKAEEYGFTAYHRSNGNITLMEQFIAADIPVITRTWLHKNDDIGHYRVVKGYDKTTSQIVQDDSFENKNIWFSYTDFDDIWKKFNYEYLVLIPKGKEQVAQNIMGENFDEKRSWENAVTTIKQEIEKNPMDIYNHFNLSVAYYHTGNYTESIQEYEKVANQLPFRTLWYQIEPIQSYYELGMYDKVITITDQILLNQNRAFSELYIIRGNIYKKQGNLPAAKSEYEKAVFYNKNLKEAKDALASL